MLKILNGKVLDCQNFSIRVTGYNPVNYKSKKHFFKMQIGKYTIYNWRKIISLTIKK